MAWKNIALIGFMGSGKTTVSKVLAEYLALPLIDVDEYIVKKNGMAIADIFQKYGEDYFRDLETEAVKEISKEKGIVLSCGGGTVLREENVKILKENGVIVLLQATPETIYNRVKNSNARPILNGNMNVQYISQLMEKRRTCYETAADMTIVTDKKGVDDIAREIIEKTVEK